MKNKLLILALSMALLSLFVVPSAVLAEDNDSASAGVNVSDNGTFAARLAGKMAGVTFSLSALKSNTVASFTLNTSNDYIAITDYTTSGANRGHYAKIKLGRKTWTYSGSYTAAPSVTVYATNGTDNPGANRLKLIYHLTDDSTTDTNTNLSAACDITETEDKTYGESANYTVATGTTTERLLVKYATTSATVCPGSFWYTPYKIRIVGPSTGLNRGVYGMTGTIVSYDLTPS